MTNDPFTTPPRRPVVSTTEARGGVSGQNVRYVLLVSLVGAIAAFTVLYFAFFARGA